MTGATGFVGRRLVKRLVDDGHKVSVLVRDRRRLGELEELVDRVVEGDLTADPDLSEAMSSVDCVFHLAATVASHTPRGYYSANTEGTRLLAQAVASAATPPLIIYCSSLSAGGPSPDARPRTEEQPDEPVSHYGRSKLAGEKILGEFSSLRYAIVRPSIVYGPGDIEFYPRYSQMIRRGMMLTAVRSPRYSLVHVDDLCDALLRAAFRGLSKEHVNGRVYYICDGVEYSLDGMGRALAEALGVKMPRIVRVPLPLVWLSAWCGMNFARVRGTNTLLNLHKIPEMTCERWTCSPERAASELGFSHSVEFSDGMAAAVAAENK
ncbi:NAD(P)-dependent oxidoreductase [Streptomyces sp. NPDC047072]|uniref:NAD-dependent epimerase/dehydratase family protein n=1 Tax=Streptomyces sp. NPDC047072 TaxID=3154809 RepID=UPI0033DAC9ED